MIVTVLMFLAVLFGCIVYGVYFFGRKYETRHHMDRSDEVPEEDERELQYVPVKKKTEE